MRVLSAEEELAGREENFAQLKSGSLFNLGHERYFIAKRKIGDKEWQVIELDEKNLMRIAYQLPGEAIVLHFDDMNCLNLC